jgi:hypothetical protein
MKTALPPRYRLYLWTAAFCLASLCHALCQSGTPQSPNATTTPPANAAHDLSTKPASAPTEKWDTPSVAGSGLKNVMELTLQENKSDVSSSEVTRVLWRAGDPIDLYITKPLGVNAPPVVMFLYDYPFETDQLLNCSACDALAREGFATVAFATALTGQRYHDRPMKEWFVSELPEALATSAHDVQLTLDYLGARGFDVDHVGIYGEGSGATIAILAAAVDPRIRLLDLVAPWGDWPEWMAASRKIPEKERPQFLQPAYLARVAPLDPAKWLPELTTQKIRIRNIKDSQETPLVAQQKVAGSVPAGATVVSYEDVKGFVTAAAYDADLKWLREWMTLSPLAPSHATAKTAERSSTTGPTPR